MHAYPEHLVTPMIEDLKMAGFKELKKPSDVEKQILNEKGTTLVVINSVCGCAAGAARPGVKWALQNSKKKPNHLTTVFAGFDLEAVEKVRELALPYPPSSPAIALFKDGELIHFVERHNIEGRSDKMIGEHLVEVFEENC